jgi:ABC-type sugar transport system substrate-binding protein
MKPDTTPEEPMTPLRFVVSLLDETQEFQRFQAADARAAAARLNLDVQTLFAENNAILQIQQLFKIVHGRDDRRRPDAILVETVSGEGLERVARAAARAGIGWILINRKASYVEALRREHPALPIGTISTDQLEIGRIQGRQFRTLLPKGGRVLYIQGPHDTSAARDRLQGTREAIFGSRIELKILEGQWTEASGRDVVERWLRLKHHDADLPDVVGCQNDMMAVGARSAMAALAGEAGVRSCLFTGVDGLPEGGERLVRTNHLAATVVVPSNTGAALYALVQALTSRNPMPAETLLPPASYPELGQLARSAGTAALKASTA